MGNSRGGYMLSPLPRSRVRKLLTVVSLIDEHRLDGRQQFVGQARLQLVVVHPRPTHPIDHQRGEGIIGSQTLLEVVARPSAERESTVLALGSSIVDWLSLVRTDATTGVLVQRLQVPFAWPLGPSGQVVNVRRSVQHGRGDHFENAYHVLRFACQECGLFRLWSAQGFMDDWS